MPFEKIYSQRLRTFPPELRDSSIQYPELKRLIGRLVDELNDLGLSPDTLREVVSRVESGSEKSISHMGIPDHHRTPPKHLEGQFFSYPIRSISKAKSVPLHGAGYGKILYEVICDSGKSFPQLRVCTATVRDARQGPPSRTEDADSMESSCESAVRPISSVRLETEATHTEIHGCDQGSASILHAAKKEFVIPLVHDTQFYQLFEGNIETLTAQMEKIHSEFLESLVNLASMIAETCQPASVAANYRPYSSVSTHAGTVEVKVKRMKGDLYAWREIFRLFVESDVFEHTIDGSKVEWSIDESEKRLNAFVDKVANRWLCDNTRLIHKRLARRGREESVKTFKHKQSADALQIFIKLIFLVLDIRRVFQANTEAIKKLVKKHTEHTSLPITCSFSVDANVLSIGHLDQSSRVPLPGLIHPRFFINDIEAKLFPVVPSQEDYSCAICTGLAFKPIRLSCTHLFCVRCLVKMQRRGEGNCPMCRAPSVLGANATNVDWALLNFMEDWFPCEAREKLRANEKEFVNEQMAMWRYNEPNCTVM